MKNNLNSSFPTRRLPRSHRSSVVSVALLLVLCSTGSRTLLAQTSFQWIGGNGNWSNAAMWTPAGVPGASDTARVNVSGDYTVTVDTAVELDFLVIGDDSTGAIVVDLGASSLTVSGSVEVISGGKLSTVDGAIVADSVIVGGTVELWAAPATADFRIMPGARFTSFRATMITGSFSNDGSTWVQAGWGAADRLAQLAVDGALTNDGTLVLYGNHSGSVTSMAVLISTQPLLNRGRIQSRGTTPGIQHSIETTVTSEGEIWVRETNLKLDVAEAAHTVGRIVVEDDLRLEIVQTGANPSVTLDDSVFVGTDSELVISSGRVDIVDPSALNTGSVRFTGFANVYLADDFILDGTPSLENAALNGPGTLSVDEGGVLDLTDATLNTDVSILEGGRLNVRRGLFSNAHLHNDGDVWMFGSWFGGGQVRATLANNLANNGRLVLWGDHSGSVIGDVQITLPDSLINRGRLVTAGTDIAVPQRINGILKNEGPLILQNRDLELSAASGDHVNEDTIRIDVTHTLRVRDGSGLINVAGSLISGDGTLDVRAAPNASTTTAGIVAPGKFSGSPGVLTVQGALQLGPDAVVDVDLAGTTRGVEYDQLVVTAALAIDGTLKIAFPDTFDSAVGDTFNIVTAGSISGTFASIDQEAQVGKHFSVVYDGNVIRVITLSGGVANENPEGEDLPRSFVLDGAYPNPFNPSTTIRFDLPHAAEVTLDAFDVLGRQVNRIGPTQMDAGSGRTVRFAAKSLPSGLYLYRLSAMSRGEAWTATGSFTMIR